MMRNIIRNRLFWIAGIASVLCVVSAGLLVVQSQHKRRLRLASLEAKLAKFDRPFLLERQTSGHRFDLDLSPEEELRLSEYDDPLLEAELFQAERAAPENHSPGTKAVSYTKYLAAFARASQMAQFSIALNHSLPSRAQMATLGQLTFSTSSLVQNEIQPIGDTGAFGDWRSLGPGNVGGRTRCLIIDPKNPKTMYAAAASGGIWKSEDGGDTWKPIADFLANIAVNALVLDPHDSNTLYAGTGEGYFNIDATRGQGIFKTSDSGQHWEALVSTNVKDFYYVRKIAISPTDSTRIYAATATGLLRSDDSGEHWAKIIDKESILGCLDLAIQPLPPNHIFVTCGTFNPGAVVRSTDSGGHQQWEEVFSMPGMGRTSIAIAPSHQGTIYALSSSLISGQFKDGLLGVFRSDRNGDPGSWTTTVDNSSTNPVNRLLLSNPIQAVYADCFGKGQNTFLNQGWYDNTIAVDPKDPNIVWAGGTDLFRSNDGGKNWGVASYWWFRPGEDPGYSHADHHVIIFHPEFDGSTNQIMFVGNDGGIFNTANSRATVGKDLNSVCGNVPSNTVQWTVKNGNYAVTQFYSGAVMPTRSINSYFGGTQDNGTVLGTDSTGSDSWATIQGGDGGYVAVDSGNPAVLYAAFTGPSIRKSNDGGSTFTNANLGLCACGQSCERQQTGCAVFPFIVPFVLDPSNAHVLWTGGNQIFRSTDGAGSWRAASAPFSAANYPASSPPTASGLLSAIAVDPGKPNVVIAGFSPSRELGSGGGWIHRSESALSADEKTIWPRVRPRAGWVSSISFDPSNSSNVYVTYSSFNSEDGFDIGHVFKSADNGKTWTPIDGAGSQKLPDIPVHSLVVDPSDSKRLYIGTDLGIFVSLDAGKSWKVENTAFPNVVVQHLVFVDSALPKLYAFTHGRGLWIVDVKR